MGGENLLIVIIAINSASDCTVVQYTVHTTVVAAIATVFSAFPTVGILRQARLVGVSVGKRLFLRVLWKVTV